MEAALSNLFVASVVVSTTLVTLLAFATVIRRLLGVRVGVVRSALAALLALFVAGRLLEALVPAPTQTDQGTLLLMILLAVSAASLLAMIVLVIAEVLLPDGSLPGPVELWRSWRSRVARTRRYWQVLRLATRHGLARFLRGRHHAGVESAAARRQLARSVRRAMEEGGVTFVKLGQLLSTRPDLVPPEFVEELSHLRDDVAPVPWDDVATVLRTELHGPIGETFAWIGDLPVAAASVAQVHAARLPDGMEVVVKVQRPGIASVVERDLDILQRLARTLETRTRWGQALGLRDLAAGFADALREELDFRVEFENLTAMAQTLGASGRSPVRVPSTFSGLSTQRMLVMEKLPGRPLGAADDLLDALGAERRHQIAATLLEAMLVQLLDRGLFHVDIHPGNVLVTDDGSLGLLDLGSVGRLDATTRMALGQLIAAVGRSDSLAASDALLELVDRPQQIDERSLERAIGALIVRYASAGSGLGPAAFAALMRLITRYRLGVPPQVAAVFRAFATLEGTLAIIDPDLDLVAEARSIGSRQLAEAMMPDRLRRAAEEDMVGLLPMLRRLPRRFDRVADAVEHGRISLNVRLFADGRDRRVVTDLLHQTLLALLGASAGVMAVMLLGIQDGPRLTPSIELYAVFGHALLVIAVVLVLRVLIVIFVRTRNEMG